MQARIKLNVLASARFPMLPSAGALRLSGGGHEDSVDMG